jgi:RNA polymerase sigma factor (sigma-70 family)
MRNEPVTPRLDPKRERDLIERARSDGAALGELYDFYVPRLYGFVVRRVGERSVAETITTTTFEQAVAALPSDAFKGISFGGWLYRAAAATILEHARTGRQLVPVTTTAKVPARSGGKSGANPPATSATTPVGAKKTTGKATKGEPPAAPEPQTTATSRTARLTGDEAALDAFAKALEREPIGAALRHVPEAHRLVLMLRFYDGLEVDEICGLLGCTRASFTGKLNRALGALRAALMKETTSAA